MKQNIAHIMYLVLDKKSRKIMKTNLADIALITIIRILIKTGTFTTNDVFVVSAGEVRPGLSTEVNVGGDILHFVEGILVKVDEG